MSEWADPTTVKAIARARAAFERARASWSTSEDDELDGEDPAGDAIDEGQRAVEHLDQGRWDEAIECAEQALVIAEDWDQGKIWREFALLVEEAAETGRD